MMGDAILGFYLYFLIYAYAPTTESKAMAAKIGKTILWEIRPGYNS